MKKENILNFIYHSYLILAFIFLSIYSYFNPKQGWLNEVILVLTLIQCYFMFHNIGKMVGIFSLTNSSFNAYINLRNSMFTSFIYSIYGAFVGIFLILQGKNEQNKIEPKKTLYKLLMIFFIGFSFFIIMNFGKVFTIILIFDLIIFSGNMCGGYLASKQLLWQFVVFIPIGIIQIITGLLLKEPVYITTSVVYLISDILSIYKWILVSKKDLNTYENK